MLRQDDFAASQLVLFGWNRGKEYGGHQAATLIMGCLANRARLGWGSLLEVIESAPKYDAELDPVRHIFPSLWQPDFVRLLHEVGPIKDGSADPAKGGLYWADSRRITNPWFTEKILGDSERHRRIGDLNTLNIYL